MQSVCQVLSFADSISYADFDAHLQTNADSTVLVELPDWRGSGILIHPSHLLTCNHVIPTADAAQTAIVSCCYRRIGDVCVRLTLLPDELFITDVSLDYTLVAIAPHPHRPAAGVFPRCPPPRKESEVQKGLYSLSHPFGAPLRISLAGKRVASREDWARRIAFTSEVHGGSSGGGVYDAQSGHLVALITHESPRYNLGTNVKAIWAHACRHPNLQSDAAPLFQNLTGAMQASAQLDATHYRRRLRLEALRLSITEQALFFLSPRVILMRHAMHEEITVQSPCLPLLKKTESVYSQFDLLSSVQWTFGA